MNEEVIQQRVKEVMASFFSVETADIGSDFSLKTVEQWDSLKHVGLMMALEQEFDVRIDVEEAVEMTSFIAVCEALSCYLGEKA